jgi:hypothetical protein
MVRRKSTNGRSKNGVQEEHSDSPKLRHVRVLEIPIKELRLCPRNDDLYRPPSSNDPDFIAIVESMRKEGQLVPGHVTKDKMIVDGHRRYWACRQLELPTFKCITIPKNSWEITPADLAQYNRQRVKTCDELVREEIALADPEESYQALLDDREKHRRTYSHLQVIDISGEKRRWRFSKAKRPFVDIIVERVLAKEEFWPLTDRRIHYDLLNVVGLLRNYGKRQIPYANNRESFGDLCEVLTRLRLFKTIPMHAIEDETRPVVEWDCFKHVGAFTAKELEDFLSGYIRDVLQTQEDHYEIIGEKMTIQSIISPVAGHFCIPYTLGRGYSSIPPRAAMAARFRKSRRRRLVLFCMSDFDPEGEDIGHSFARSMRDDFGIKDLVPIKVALTRSQVEQYNLPPNMIAKSGSSRRKDFVEKHGEYVHELESLQPDVLQGILRDAIDGAIDVDAFNHQRELERKDAIYLQSAIKTMKQELPKMLPPAEGA